MTLSDRVRAALTRGDWCHREPEFAEPGAGDQRRRSPRYHPDLAGDYEAALLTGSGTAAVEAMLASFAPDERRTLVIANGVYGERMARMLAAHGKPHRVLHHEWTSGVDIQALERTLEQDPSISHVAVVHHETTTGRLNDLEAIGRACQARGVQLLLDGVSSFGAERIAGREWNLAAVAATANKCLHGAPGLSFVLGSPRTVGRPAGTPGQRLSRSARLSPRAARRRLLAVHAGGADRVRAARGAGRAPGAGRLAGAAREYTGAARRASVRYLAALGVTTLLSPSEYSAVLWSYRLPAGMTYASLHDALKMRGFVIYAGQGHLSPEIFRIAHMGDIRDDDIERLCAALRIDPRAGGTVESRHHDGGDSRGGAGHAAARGGARPAEGLSASRRAADRRGVGAAPR